MPRPASPSRIFWLQAGVLGAAMVAVAVPPANGAMLLVPVTHAAEDMMVANAVRGGARLIGTGPLPGSLLVAGARADIRATLGAGVLVLAAPPGGCLA